MDKKKSSKIVIVGFWLWPERNKRLQDVPCALLHITTVWIKACSAS